MRRDDPTRSSTTPVLRAAGLAALAAAALALAFPASGGADDAPARARAATRTLEPVNAGGLRFVVEISRVANLFHWVDNLAGTSPAKTRETYVETWIARHGPLSEDDRRALKGFRDARLMRAPRGAPFPRGSGCLPEALRPLKLPQRVSIAALSARDAADFAERIALLLPPERAAAMASALERFAPRFDAMWRETDHVEPFAADLRRFLARDDVGRLVARLVRFYEADADREVPVTISLVALPRRGPTHAEANGHHLLVEVRPGDRAVHQVPVVFHELAHDLARRVPEERREALARAFFSRGATGSMAWTLLHEGLPTALGQGVAHYELSRRGFSRRVKWYHRREIDLFARGIFPDVRRELSSGRTAVERLPGLACDWLDKGPLRAAPLPAYLGESALAGSGRVLGALASVERALVAYHAWRVRWDEPRGASFLRRYECMPLVVVATQEELASMPRGVRSLLPEVSEDRLPLAAGLAGLVVPGRRGSGAPSLLVVLAGPEDGGRVVRALRASSGWPRRPIEVPG